MKKEEILNIIKKSGLLVLLIMTLILLTTTILFFAKISVSKFHFPVTCFMSVVLFLIYFRKEKKIENLIAILLTVLIFAISILSIGKIYDETVDGNTYHKLTTGGLKNGWNPSYESILDFKKSDGNAFDVSDRNVNANWADHYAKATEIFASVIYDCTENIETGKCYTLLFMYVVFVLTFVYLYKEKNLNLFASLIIPLLLTVNPITIVQIANYYVDGALMLNVFLIIYACINETERKDEENLDLINLFILFSGIIWCINIKFTGICFAGAFCSVFYFYWIWKNIKINKHDGKSRIKVYTIFYIITVLTAFLIVGFSSYTKNTIDHGNPLYPLYGKGNVRQYGYDGSLYVYARDEPFRGVFSFSVF